MDNISAEAVPQLLTKIRGAVRRLPDGLKKEQFSLLAAQLENKVPAAAIARQISILQGEDRR